MNRLEQYLDDEEPLMPERNYWVVETQTGYWVVSADTAREVEHVIERLWRPRWLVFRDLTGGRRRIRTGTVECLYESTSQQRAYRRAFDRERALEEKAGRPGDEGD